MSELKLVPTRPERLADRLYGQILEQIVSGAIREGDKLPSELQICRAFSVSRPTVREALMRLQADGLVLTRQGAGTFVQRRPSDTLTRLANTSDIAGMLRSFEVRMPLEGQSAALAAERRTPDQLAAIEAALEQLRTEFEGAGVPARADFAFHRAVAAASGNELFSELLAMLQPIVEQSMSLALSLTRTGSRDRARRVVEEHETIVDAIRRADPEGAALAMRYHLHRSRQRVTDRQRDQ